MRSIRNSAAFSTSRSTRGSNVMARPALLLSSRAFVRAFPGQPRPLWRPPTWLPRIGDLPIFGPRLPPSFRGSLRWPNFPFVPHYASCAEFRSRTFALFGHSVERGQMDRPTFCADLCSQPFRTPLANLSLPPRRRTWLLSNRPGLIRHTPFSNTSQNDRQGSDHLQPMLR